MARIAYMLRAGFQVPPQVVLLQHAIAWYGSRIRLPGPRPFHVPHLYYFYCSASDIARRSENAKPDQT